MSPEQSAQAVLKKAMDQENTYSWLEAVDSYRQALGAGLEGASSVPEIWERIGRCYLLSSRQAENIDEFKKHAQLAVDAYNTAGGLWERDGGTKSRGRSLQQYGLAEYVRSWFAPNPSEKREALSRSCELGKKSLEAYDVVGEELDRGRTCNDIQTYLYERLYVASDSEEIKNVALEGIHFSDQAIAILSKSGDKSELLRAYFTASLLGWYVANFSELEGRQELVKKSLSYSEKALELSKEVDDPHHGAMSNWAASLCTLVFTEKAELACDYAEKMLEQGTSVRDHYLKGIAFYLLAFVTDWMMLRETDPDTQREGYRNIISYAEEAAKCLQPLGQDFYIAETFLFYAESLSNLGRYVEKSPEEKRRILEKAASVGRKAVEHATRSGSMDAVGSALHALSKALHSLSTIETRDDEKTRLLQEALGCREEFGKIVQRAFPSNDWLSGVNKSYQGLIKQDMERTEKDQVKKRMLLESAARDMKDGISHCGRWVATRPVPSQITTLGSYEDRFGAILYDLYALTKDRATLSKAVEVHEDAAEQFRKVGLPNRAAESHWKMARNQHRLGEVLKAAENFEKASEDYTLAAKNNPKFAEFYDDYASYMKAWSEIERASVAHESERYLDATKHYEKTVDLLRQTKSWSYLSPNFSACSLLEHAEDLSRRENSAESIETFRKAADCFNEAKRASETEIEKIQNLDEKELAIELSKASVRRMNYCLARIALEEARIFDRKGNHEESADRYESAAQLFERIAVTLDTEVDRREIEPISYMCRAWQKMKMADKANSPELYREASELFLKAKEHTTRNKSILLASGNSAFCMALENGTEFESTREREHFSKTKQYLESAASYYLKAGFENASIWTNATEMLFDAYNYMISAEIESDPEKKTKTYLLAEKCLERSARLSERAGYTGKREEVLKTLSNVEEKRKFAVSLADLLTAPIDASSPQAISAPRLTVEQPVGLLKFEHAFLQGNLIVQEREVLVGESFSVEIQLLNLGKDSAFLLRAKDLIPNEFVLVEKPEKCAIKDGLLDLKGRRLQPLETTEITVKLKSSKKGRFTFTPAVEFVDEAGNGKVCELEQVTVRAREMGIRGWLKGR
jgi:tetratricopeptide (TPR) repeat protein